MRGERQLLRVGEYLVSRASKQLPRKARQERYREWAAELPAILHDPLIRFAPRRAIRMLAYAADTFRGTALTHVTSRRRWLELAATAAAGIVVIVALGGAISSLWSIAQSPTQPLNYLQLIWSLLLGAYAVSLRVRPTARVTVLLIIGVNLMGVVVSLWTGAENHGDWVNYLWAAALIFGLLVWWPLNRWVHTRRGNAAHKRT
ncbi:MAG TPA: hypothetical protein VME44_29420 [Streptosporangiaceae bacterium]|nr:hypothetical protein [Streptosporangiaceae bacterium]